MGRSSALTGESGKESPTMTKRYAALAGGFLLAMPILLWWATAGQAQEWRRSEPRYPQRDDA